MKCFMSIQHTCSVARQPVTKVIFMCGAELGEPPQFQCGSSERQGTTNQNTEHLSYIVYMCVCVCVVGGGGIMHIN